MKRAINFILGTISFLLICFYAEASITVNDGIIRDIGAVLPLFRMETTIRIVILLSMITPLALIGCITWFIDRGFEAEPT
ncbi:MAG: hypothetical protein NTX15_11325 [Candidatus Kapabacteria bacterium]|nr:hypothetical protein [Candidatus Kapabacteria bacterium]